MSQYECIARLGGWEGYRVAAVRRFEAGVRGPRPQVWIELHPWRGRFLGCRILSGGGTPARVPTYRSANLTLYDP